MMNALTRAGEKTIAFFTELGNMAIFLVRVFALALKPPYRFKLLLE